MKAANIVRLRLFEITLGILLVLPRSRGGPEKNAAEDTSCPSHMFGCSGKKSGNSTSSHCIYQWLVCNGMPDCRNSADERPDFCRSYRSKLKDRDPKTVCEPPAKFPCGPADACIQSSKICDGVRDCHDGSDELQRACELKKKINEFYLQTPNMYNCFFMTDFIQLNKLCNGKEECIDGSDEGVFCESKRCDTIRSGCLDGECHESMRGPVCQCRDDEFFNPFVALCQAKEGPCQSKPCQHTCTTRPSSDDESGMIKSNYVCSCRRGYNLVDRHKCIAKGAVKLIIQKYTSSVLLSDFVEDKTVKVETGTIQDVQGFDIANDTVCYKKNNFRDLVCSKLSDANATWKYNLAFFGSDMFAYDWLSRNWYCRKNYGVVRVCSFDFGVCSVLGVGKGEKDTNSIMVDPMAGYIFMQSRRSIERMTMTITERQTVVKTTDLSSWITSSALDVENEFVYFVKRRFKDIYRISYTDARVETVFSQPLVLNIRQIGILGDYMYVSFHSSRDAMNRINLRDPTDIFVFNTTFYNKFTLLHEILQPLDQSMGDCKGNCSHVCIQQRRPLNSTCTCLRASPIYSPGYCVASPTPATPTTKEGEDDKDDVCNKPDIFRCNNRACINKRWMCDGSDDCGDNSDETDPDCKNRTCGENMFRCNDNHCIYMKWLCDEEADCGDGEDEDPDVCSAAVLTCSGNFTLCGHGTRCIPNTWLCDGEVDCEDEMDEENCTKSDAKGLCPATSFTCWDTPQCIDMELVCDGKSDCKDSTDEFNCKTTSSPDEGFGVCDSSRKFLCAKTRKCLSKLQVCDGTSDCGSNDHSDELNCTHTFLCVGNPAYLPCNNGFCILDVHRCDGFDDCGDNSDEADCPDTPANCSSSEFRCLSGKCVPGHWRCDEGEDCPDKSDELDCDPAIYCEPPSIVCGWKCVTLDKLCDGEMDCPNGEDEGGSCKNSPCQGGVGCSHLCANTPSGFVCLCPFHLTMGDDGKTCKKKSACGSWGVCSQVCEEVGEVHKCSCHEGYILQPDKFSCIPDDAKKMAIIFSNRHELRQLDPQHHSYTTLVAGQRNVIALSFFYDHKDEGRESFVFWNDVVEDKIYKGTFNSAATLTDIYPIVERGLMTTEGLAVDWITEHLYWVESTLDQIEVSNFFGGQRLTVVSQNLTNPRGIAVDPVVGYLFWTDWDSSVPRIERSNMDGEDRRVIFNVSSVIGSGWPNGIAVDFEVERLYWVDARSDSIHTVDYDGGDHREVIRSHESLTHPFAISVFGNNVYWSDWKSNAIYSANKWNGSNLKMVERTITQPFDLRIFHPKVQKSVSNPCSENPCGRGAVCLLSANRKASCKCPLITQMVSDNCRHVDKMLFILLPTQLRGVYLDDVSKNAMVTVVMHPDSKPTDVDYDASRDVVFISDAGNLTVGILRADMLGSETKYLDVADQRVESIAYDWASGLLYSAVSRGGGGQLVVSKSDGTLRAKLDVPPRFTQRPHSLVVDPYHESLFWVDASVPMIFRVSTDGSRAAPVFPLKDDDDDDDDWTVKNVSEIYSLTFNKIPFKDHKDDHLWWVVRYNVTKQAILHCSVAMGTKCRPIRFTPNRTFADDTTFENITSLLVNDDVVYYSHSARSNSVEVVRLSDPDLVATVIKKNISNVISLKMFDRMKNYVVHHGCYSNNGGCNHLCVPRFPGMSVVCLCAIGYSLDASDNKTCRGHGEFLLYSGGPEIGGVKQSEDGLLSFTEVFPSISGVKYVVSLDFVYDDDLVVYMDNHARALTSVRRDLTNKTVVMTAGITGAEYITVDWLARNIYWTDAVHDYIFVCRLDGRHKHIIVHSNEKPFDIVVDPINGYLYWSEVVKERHTHSGLKRSRLDGSNVTSIIEANQKRSPARFLTFDAYTNRLYWFELSSESIYFYDTLAYPPEGAKELMIVPVCLGLAAYGPHVYWALHNGTIMRASAQPHPQDAEVYIQRLPTVITDITWFRKQPNSSSNPCQVNNGGCQQLCLFNGTHPVCRCSYGKISRDQTKCEEHKIFLAFSKAVTIETMSLERTPHEDGFDPNPVFAPISDRRTMTNVIGLSFDRERGRYFYSDIQQEKILAVNYNGENFETIVETVGSVEGLTYDHLVKELYWTSYTHFAIFKLSFDHLTSTATNGSRATSHKGTKIVELAVGDHPRSIVHDPCFSKLYWTNWNPEKPSIMSSGTDGSNLRYVITSDIKTPNSITVDHMARKLYWSDAKLDKIEECNIDGSERKVILSGIPQHSFGLTVHRDYLYWTDWLMKAIIRLDIVKGTTKMIKNFKFVQPMGIVVVTDESVDCSINPCNINNGGCTHVCTSDANDRRICSCPKGLILSTDQSTCMPHKDCGGWYSFQCDNEKCLPYDQVCDGRDDCGDGSDEVLCSTCAKNKFKCRESDTCVELSRRCDSVKDCSDASDEKNCPPNLGCVAPRVACNRTTSCIEAANVCNGVDDCWDMEDEQNCIVLNCAEGRRQCKDGRKCIDERLWCDGEKDCSDGSDEEGCARKNCSDGYFFCDKACFPDLLKCDGFLDCVDGTDETDCKYANVTCLKPDFLKCPGSNLCIHSGWFCNGVKDCPNGADEYPNSEYCEPYVCKSGEYMCGSDDCIPLNFVCDGEEDCMDGSDERQEHCESKDHCLPNQFKCASEMRCIPLEKKCNGKINCKDHSDEDVGMCTSRSSCVEGIEFACSIIGKKARKEEKLKNSAEKVDGVEVDEHVIDGPSVKCVNMAAFCNGSANCADGQDQSRRALCGVQTCINNDQCEQICVQYIVGHACKCMTGYQLNADHLTCSDINECDKYICTQQCTNTVGGYKCSCSTNYTMEADNSCHSESGVEATLLMSNRYYIRSVSLDGSSINVLVSNLQNAVALDFDWKEQMIYWSDVTSIGSNITRMKVDGSMQSIVHSSTLRSPDGIAVDWIGRNLYWCDKTKDTIEVSKLDGRYRKVLVKSGLHEPRAIVLHPFQGMMFYSDWGDDPHIGRLGMDGSGRVVIVGSDILGWPNALAVDLIADRLWWVDAKLDYIAVSNLEGGNMRYIIRDHLPHVFSLAMFEDYIYWADWEFKSVERAHKLTGAKRKNLTYTTQRPMAIQIFHPFTKPERIHDNHSNPCTNDGQCPLGSLCLIKLGGSERVCTCPERHYMSDDGAHCISNCTSSEFKCTTTYKCIPFWWRCDGQNDCGDYSDEPESICPTYHCKFPGMFQCKNATSSQHCFVATRICDGESNCKDGSDETDCGNYTCMESQFKCEDKCISQLSRCNGVPDCKGGEDERDCPKSTCARNHFQCKNSRCIPLVWKCDGDNDCGDNSDEPPDCATQKCPPGYLKCASNGKCVPETWKCDGDFDCGENDQTDENPDVCYNVTCSGTYFKCKNNRCIPGRWKCDYEDDCRDGSDEEDCVPRVCNDSEFQCLTTQQCILKQQRCDGMVQCQDGTDEAKCDEALECDASTSFRCNSTGLCIPKVWACDRFHDCLDGSDEMNCLKNFTIPCNGYEKACNDGQCIPEAWWCDGMDDCVDESDESPHHCSMAACRPGYFQCANKSCILKEFLCDGLSQCPDGSDELHCPAKVCLPTEFECLSKQCVAIHSLCNGLHECSDGSDEDTVLCRGYLEACSADNICDPMFTCRYGRQDIYLMMSHFPIKKQCECPKMEQVYNIETNKCEATLDSCTEENLCSQVCLNGNCHCHVALMRANKLIQSCILYDHARIVLNADGHLFSMDDHLSNRPMRRFPKEQTFLPTSPITQPMKITSLNYASSPHNSSVTHLYFYSQSDNSVYKMKIHVDQNSKTDNLTLDEDAVKVATIGSADDIAIDWLDNHLYWIDSANSRILMSDLFGSNLKTVVDVHLHVPLAIAVDPFKKKLCWTIVGFHARIECSNLDGSARTSLVDSKIIWPTDLVFDSPNMRVYWADMKKQTVESIRLDGGGRRTVWTFHKTNSSHLNLPFRLDVLADFIYILLHRPCKIMKVNKFGPVRNHLIEEELDCHAEVDDLLVIHQSKRGLMKTDTHSLCKGRKCPENSVCFNLPSGGVCSCIDGFVKNEQEVCVVRNQSDDPCQDYCLHDGECTVTEVSHPKCSCKPGFGGARCEQNLCYGFCSTNGTTRPCYLDEMGQQVCSCKAEFEGPRCEYNKCEKFCHGGVCFYNPLFNTRKCLCRAGHVGERCEKRSEDICEGFVCHNGGVCVSGNRTRARCVCPPHYTGHHCEKCKPGAAKKSATKPVECGPCFHSCTNSSLSSCQVSNCLHHPETSCSLESSYPRCTCPRGFVSRCSSIIINDDPPFDNQNAQSDDSAKGSGDDDRDDTDDGDVVNQNVSSECYACVDSCFQRCLNNGTCRHEPNKVEPVCDCSGAFRGMECETTCHSCSPTGTRKCWLGEDKEEKCECNAGYRGERCNECYDDICSSRGVCHVDDNDGGLRCTCNPGYSGTNCEEDVGCSEGACHNNGTCSTADDQTYFCLCPDGFAGDLCQNLSSGSSHGKSAILMALLSIFLIALVVLFGIFVYKKSRNQFSHKRMVENGMNMEISNPMYLKDDDDDDDDDQQCVTLGDNNASVNFTSPSYSRRHEVNTISATVPGGDACLGDPTASTSETAQLLDSSKDRPNR